MFSFILDIGFEFLNYKNNLTTNSPPLSDQDQF